MTIVVLRRLLVFAMAVIGFLTLHLSGEMHPAVVGLFYAAVIGGWFWDEPRVEFSRWQRPWTALTLLMFGFTLIDIFFVGEFFLTSAMNFLVFLAGAKLFQLAENKDFTQMMALSLLLLTSGSVLNEQLSFGVLFGLFVLASTLALTVQHLNVEVWEHEGRRATRTRMDRAVFWVTLGLATVVFVGAVGFFFAFPRIGFGFFVQQNRRGAPTTGFGDTVELGRHGTIREDSTIVMRVVFPEGSPPDVRNRLYWRGISLDHWTGRRWIDEDERGAERGIVRREADGRGYLIDQPQRVSWEEAIDDTIVSEIHLEPIDSDVLFTIGRFQAVSLPDNVTELPDSLFARSLRADVTGEVTLTERSSVGVRYIAYSTLDIPSDDTLRAATWSDGAASLPELMGRHYRAILERRGQPIPVPLDPLAPEAVRAVASAGDADLQRWAELAGHYLQLPGGQVTDRMRALIGELRAGTNNDHDFVVAVRDHLRTALEYTTDIPQPTTPEANLVDEFLFEWQRGHCEYFATTMVVLLRAEGIPARIVNGFLGADHNSVGDYYAVRQANGHSWVEVYFPGDAGWVRFDPTPAGAPEIGGDGLWWKMQMFVDNLRLKWFRWVIEYDLEKQATLVRDAMQSFRGEEESAVQVSNRVTEAMRSAALWLWHHARAIFLLTVLWLGSAAAFRSRARRRIPWGRLDNVAAVWVVGATVVISRLWPERWTIVSVLVGLGPPLVGIAVAHILRRDLFETGVGRRVRARGSDIVSMMYAQLLRAAERETGDLALSTTPRELVGTLDLEDPALVDEVRAFTEFYEAVRFAGFAVSDAELARWRVRHRRLLRGVVRDLRVQTRRYGG